MRDVASAPPGEVALSSCNIYDGRLLSERTFNTNRLRPSAVALSLRGDEATARVIGMPYRRAFMARDRVGAAGDVVAWWASDGPLRDSDGVVAPH